MSRLGQQREHGGALGLEDVVDFVLGQHEQVVLDRLRVVELFAVDPELHEDILSDILGHVVVFEHPAYEVQQRGVVAHE